MIQIGPGNCQPHFQMRISDVAMYFEKRRNQRKYLCNSNILLLSTYCRALHNFITFPPPAVVTETNCYLLFFKAFVQRTTTQRDFFERDRINSNEKGLHHCMVYIKCPESWRRRNVTSQSMLKDFRHAFTGSRNTVLSEPDDNESTHQFTPVLILPSLMCKQRTREAAVAQSLFERRGVRDQLLYRSCRKRGMQLGEPAASSLCFDSLSLSAPGLQFSLSCIFPASRTHVPCYYRCSSLYLYAIPWSSPALSPDPL